MDEARARALLAGERAQLQRLLRAEASEEDDDEPPPAPSLGIHIEPDHRTR
jgi:hypothetical protein